MENGKWKIEKQKMEKLKKLWQIEKYFSFTYKGVYKVKKKF